MPTSPDYRPDSAILELGGAFYDEVEPARFPRHVLRFRNDRAARDVGLAALSPDAWEAAFARFEPLPDALPRPLALRYHGHQFGVYNPALGDGRGFLFAELRDARGRLLDLGTKGSGTTPYSRGGDGRLTLKGGVREVLAAETLEALGVPTSRALSLFETGERLLRSDEPSPTRSSVLVRLGFSHVRFGTFQRLAHLRDAGAMRRLLDWCILHYFPELGATEGDARVVAFLDRVARASADLTAAWMTAGFCHGVLNTDNLTITGDSFDYGPWRFVPTFDPDFVAAYFDETGLYAFGRQPAVVLWNLGKLADALRVLAPSAPLGAPLAAFEDRYDAALTARTLARLGLASCGEDLDVALATAAWAFLDSTGAPFERFFFDLHADRRALRGLPSGEPYEGPRFDDVVERLALFAPRAPAPHAWFDRDAPCTMLVDEVEALWSAIDARDDWAPFDAKIEAVRAMGAALAIALDQSLQPSAASPLTAR